MDTNSKIMLLAFWEATLKGVNEIWGGSIKNWDFK